jgi:hypothetical protein
MEAKQEETLMIRLRLAGVYRWLGALMSGLALTPTLLNAQELPQSFSVTWSPGADRKRIDRGVGIAYFATGAGMGVRADTILVRARPTSTTKVTGGFLYEETQKGIAWRYGVAAPKRLHPNVVEYGYEEAGVPLDSVSPGRSWSRVILGFDAADAPYRGWVKLDSTRVRHLLWAKVLAGNRVFFLEDSDPRLFDRPEGKELPIRVQVGDNSDYIMHPLEARGPWLRVRVAQPADICVAGGTAAGLVLHQGVLKARRADAAQ